jgi:hypothetical protein
MVLRGIFGSTGKGMTEVGETLFQIYFKYNENDKIH